MVKRTLIKKVEQGYLDTISRHCEEMLIWSSGFFGRSYAMSHSNKPFATLVLAHGKMQLDRTLEEVRIGNTLEQQLTVQGMMKMSPSQSSSMSPKF